MTNTFKHWLRGLRLLRHPELVRYLGERQAELRRIEAIRRACPGAVVSDDVRLVGDPDGRLILAARSVVESGTLLVFGDELNGFGRIVIGAGSWVGQLNNLRAGGGADVTIGKQCLISQYCTLVATNHGCERSRPIMDQEPPAARRGVTLKDDVWLGAGVTVLPGVEIEQGAVIGAGAVVTRNVPAYEIWGGLPARRIGVRQ